VFGVLVTVGDGDAVVQFGLEEVAFLPAAPNLTRRWV